MSDRNLGAVQQKVHVSVGHGVGVMALAAGRVVRVMALAAGCRGQGDGSCSSGSVCSAARLGGNTGQDLSECLSL